MIPAHPCTLPCMYNVHTYMHYAICIFDWQLTIISYNMLYHNTYVMFAFKHLYMFNIHNTVYCMSISRLDAFKMPSCIHWFESIIQNWTFLNLTYTLSLTQSDASTTVLHHEIVTHHAPPYHQYPLWAYMRIRKTLYYLPAQNEATKKGEDTSKYHLVLKAVDKLVGREYYRVKAVNKLYGRKYCF